MNSRRNWLLLMACVLTMGSTLALQFLLRRCIFSHASPWPERIVGVSCGGGKIAIQGKNPHKKSMVLILTREGRVVWKSDPERSISAPALSVDGQRVVCYFDDSGSTKQKTGLLCVDLVKRSSREFSLSRGMLLPPYRWSSDGHQVFCHAVEAVDGWHKYLVRVDTSGINEIVKLAEVGSLGAIRQCVVQERIYGAIAGDEYFGQFRISEFDLNGKLQRQSPWRFPGTAYIGPDGEWTLLLEIDIPHRTGMVSLLPTWESNPAVLTVQGVNRGIAWSPDGKAFSLITEKESVGNSLRFFRKPGSGWKSTEIASLPAVRGAAWLNREQVVVVHDENRLSIVSASGKRRRISPKG